jgi:hypothetical protein
VGENIGEHSILRTAAVFAENQPQRVAEESASPLSHCEALRLVEDDTAAFFTRF